jgi:PAS domain S-box-containing protein
VWPSIGPDPSGSTSAILYGHGPAFWGSLGYAYALFLAGTIVFLRNAWRAQPHQRRQALVMAVAALIPWLWSVAYAAGWSPIPGLDFTPIGFALSGLLIAVDIGRFGFLDVVPAAFEMLFETFRDSALVLDGEGKIVRMNDSAELLLGLTDAQNGRHWSEAFARYPDLAAFIGEHEGPGETIAGEMTLGGRVLDVRLLRIANEQHRLLGRVLMLRDVTLRRRAEDEIRSSLEAKENLLKEVHHRVKNNMQVISSLLSLQSEAINDPGVRTLYRESENRVRSMILVHDRLSRAESHTELDFGAYLRTLVNDLVASSSRQKVDVHFALEPVVVPARIAASCGLIVNEIVSNALKHAFVGRDSGKVTVTLAAPATGTVRLTIADDGVGLPRDTGDLGGRTLGMTIIENLVHQIKGSLAIRVEKGTTFAIEFPCG